MTAPSPTCTQLSTADWLAAGSSAMGTSHLADSAPCQDSHGLKELPRGGFLAAVADGAGSAAKSEVGSRLAVDVVLAFLAQRLESAPPADDTAWATLIREAFDAAATALVNEAVERNLPLTALSTTLMLAVVHPQRSLMAGVGDCVAVAQTSGSAPSPDGAQGTTGEWSLPIKPARGEYANETTFLTSPGWPTRLQVEFLAATPERVALFSDGLLRLALNLAAAAPHAPFFNSVFAFLTSQPSLDITAQALGEFLQSDRVNARTDDDKTLVVAWRCPVV